MHVRLSICLRNWIILWTVAVLNSNVINSFKSTVYRVGSENIMSHIPQKRLSLVMVSRPMKSVKVESLNSSTKRSTTKVKKLYNVPGYMKGDLTLIRTVFDVKSVSGILSFEDFLDSKYLRFWPGRNIDVRRIWCEISEKCSVSCPITDNELPSLLHRLDEVAYQTEEAMKMERINWEIEDMKYDHLDNFFEKNAKLVGRSKKLSFNQFISFESVQAEMWYNEKGLTVNVIAEIWEKLAGCVSRHVEKETFIDIYNKVCKSTYQL